MPNRSLPRALDAPISEVDTQRLLELAKAFGDLNDSHLYAGSSRGGYKRGSFVLHGEHHEPFDFSELMNASFWRWAMNFNESSDQAGTMLTAKGGMDHIVKGFMRHVGDAVHLNAWVKGVELTDRGVRVSYIENGERKTEEADYVLNSIPTHLLLGLRHNFPKDYVEALSKPKRGELFKMGLQASKRFWEDDRIYGGVTWTSQPITQIWYPNHGFHSQKGILLAAYTFFPGAGAYFTRLTPEERFQEVLRQGGENPPGLGAVHRERRERRLAPHEPHDGVLRGVVRGRCGKALQAPSAPGGPSLPDRGPNHLSHGVAGGRHALSPSCHGRH